MRINTTWTDLRLEFLNLQNDSYLNMVSDRERVGIWIPGVGYSNAKTGTLALDDYSSMMVIKRKLQHQIDSKRVREEAIYSGRENEIQHLQR